MEGGLLARGVDVVGRPTAPWAELASEVYLLLRCTILDED
jgi:hypothetical protein